MRSWSTASEVDMVMGMVVWMVVNDGLVGGGAVLPFFLVGESWSWLVWELMWLMASSWRVTAGGLVRMVRGGVEGVGLGKGGCAGEGLKRGTVEGLDRFLVVVVRDEARRCWWLSASGGAKGNDFKLEWTRCWMMSR